MFPVGFFYWKTIYEKTSKGLHKSTENANVIFSRMNIIFFSNTGNVIFRCIFLVKDHLCFFNRKVISHL